MFSQLYIKTSDRQVNLLALNQGQKGGFGIEDYQPGRPNAKGGGVWQDSPIAAGRRFVYGVQGNVIDTMTLQCASNSHAALIEYLNEFDELLDQSMDYWSAPATNPIEPVYLVARAAGEADERYAIIYGYSFESYGDIYDQPYLTNARSASMVDLVLSIEHSEWRQHPPGSMTEVAITNTPNGATPETGGVYVQSQSGQALTVMMYRFDASAGTYSTEINAGAKPYNLFPSPMAAGDILYIRTNPSQPFGSLVFNLGTVSSGITYQLQYWNGSSWVQSGTFAVEGVQGFTQAGETLIEWAPSEGWATTTVSTFGSAYWIRLVTSAVAGSIPTQTATVYVPNQPYVEIAASQVEGDLDALAMLTARVDHDHRGTSLNAREHMFGQMIVGLRSVDRGSSFNAYLNFGNLPTGITFDNSQKDYVDTPTTGFVYPPAPYGTVVEWDVDATDTFGEAFRLNFNAAAAAQYRGTYRLFLRFATEIFTAAKYASFRYRALTTYPAGAYNTTPTLIENIGDTVRVQALEGEAGGDNQIFQVVDLGRVVLPPIGGLAEDETSQGFSLVFDMGFDYVAAQTKQYIADAILIPVDEWAAQLDAGMNLFRLNTQDFEWTVDSLISPKTPLRSHLRYSPTTTQILGSAQHISNGPMILKKNRLQRLWFFTVPLVDSFASIGHPVSGDHPPRYRINNSLKIRLFKNQRYHFLRGD